MLLVRLWIFGVICCAISYIFSRNYEEQFVNRGFYVVHVRQEEEKKWKQTKKGKITTFFWNIFSFLGIIFGIGIPIKQLYSITTFFFKNTTIEVLKNGAVDVFWAIIVNLIVGATLFVILYALFRLLNYCDIRIFLLTNSNLCEIIEILAIAVCVIFAIFCIAYPLVSLKTHFETLDNIIVTEHEDIVTEERILTIFCEIPTQNVNGYVNGNFFHGNGTVEGRISTNDVLPYWYLPNGNYPAEYDIAPANASKLYPIAEGEKPYLKITKHTNITITDNQNPWGEKQENINSEWTEYEFFLPEYIVGKM